MDLGTWGSWKDLLAPLPTQHTQGQARAACHRLLSFPPEGPQTVSEHWTQRPLPARLPASLLCPGGPLGVCTLQTSALGLFERMESVPLSPALQWLLSDG